MFVLIILNGAKINPPIRPDNQVFLEMVRNGTQLTTSCVEMLLASQHSQKNSGKEIDKASKRIKTISASKAHKDDTYLEPLLPQKNLQTSLAILKAKVLIRLFSSVVSYMLFD
jgi:hypothetical protein